MDGQERAVKQSHQTAAFVVAARRQQAKELARRRKELEIDETWLGRLEEQEAAETAPPPPKVKCYVCQAEPVSGRGMGVNSLITGASVLCHVQTGQQGGCWSIMQRARAAILPHCRTGPKVHDKILGDRLLREEVDRLMTRPKFQAEVAGQWEASYHLTAKTAVAVRMDKIEQEFEVLKRAQLGSREPEQGYREDTLRALRERATHNVDEREAARYTDPDVEFSETPARDENYPGEHQTENERE